MKEFTVKVTSITTLTVEAKNEDEAIDGACSEAWEHDADEINAEILEEDEEAKNIRDDLEAICDSEKSGVKIKPCKSFFAKGKENCNSDQW